MSISRERNRCGLIGLVKSLLGDRLGAALPSRLRAWNPPPCAAPERLEPRMLLAAAPYISEFMAWNDDAWPDEDGDHPGWVEIANPGIERIDLTGYHLTDDKLDLDKWTFPAGSGIDAGGYLVVFMAKDEPTAGTQLRTNFKLDNNGEYLALVQPDGQTIVSHYDPQYPRQLEDISYGIGTDLLSAGLLPTKAPHRVLVPTNGALGTSWTAVDFQDDAWRSGTGGVGYDIWTAPPQIPGFTVKMVDFTGGIQDITTATRILDDPASSGYAISTVVTKDALVVNHGPGGDFFPDEPLPDGQSTTEEYALRFTANIFIPQGTWTFDVNSDDGFSLTIPGVTFTNRYNENYANVPDGIVANRLVYSQPRGPNHTSGTITVPAGGLSTTLTLDFYENGGGDDVELSVASGQQTFNGNFVLLSDGALPNWSVKTTSSTPPPDYRPLIGTNVQAEMLNRTSAYIRIPLKEVENPEDYDLLRLRVMYDDGFVAYLNGQKIAARNAPDSPAWSSAATGTHADTQAIVFEDIDIPLTEGMLLPGIGTNVLAIHALNASADAEDFLFLADLLGLTVLEQAPRYFQEPTPGRPNVQSSLSEVVADTTFSHSRGFYDQPFMLAINCATPDAEIRYTLDGSTPTATWGNVLNRGELIPINGTTTVRAAAFKPNAIPTNVDTVTFLFTSDIITQSANGQAPAGWPASWSPNTTDYGMDPDVVNNPLYASELESALKSIPTFSLVTDLGNLFGPSGIYSNAGNSGRAWERPASLELIYADGTQGFQIDAGIRIRGGFSASAGNPKHAFRVYFRDEYGAGRLNYPLFGDDGAQWFDNIDLRTFQNYSWSFQGDSRGIFIRDQLSRDLQLAMGQPGKRGYFVHLYINGQYWGLFDLDERAISGYGESYFGGDKDEYDVIKHGGGGVHATDGNMLAWTDLWNQAKVVGNDLGRYMRMQGLNPDGTRNPDYPVLLDPDNLIDYMFAIFWGGNFDSPLSRFMGMTGVNNVYWMRNRNGEEGFKFFIHDAEHTMIDGFGMSALYADQTGPFWENPDPGIGTSNPQYLWQYLMQNTEFRMRVADRMNKHFRNGGALTAENVTALFEKRVAEIYSAVVAESARWGDAKRSSPFTRNNEWLAEINRLRTGYLPYRSDVVFNQLVADGFWPNVNAPVFDEHGGTVALPFDVVILNAHEGQVYYTINGPDPRAIGGGLNGQALLYQGPITLTGNAVVRARIKVGEDWSALTEATFYNDLSALRISELMYNPPPHAGGADAQEYEFVELLNTGSATLDLTGVRFTEGISFEFDPGTTLAPQQRIVLARNPAAFAQRYPGISAVGPYGGFLENNGERLQITGPGGLLLDFRYKDWYDSTKGLGYALAAINPAAPAALYGQKSSWMAGNALYGRPGQADPGVPQDAIVINEVMTNPSPGGEGDWIELHNTTDQPIDISGWFLSDDPANLTKYQIPVNTTIPAGGFVVFTQAAHFGNPADPGTRIVFELDRAGDDVLLTSNDGAGVGGYRESIDFAAAATEVTFGRHLKSTGGKDIVALSAPTRGMPNAAPAVGPVVISEIMYHPILGQEYIELLNLTGAQLPLYDPANPGNTWKFNEGVDYTFPQGATLPPFGYALVVGIDPDVFRTTYSIPAAVPIFGPYTGNLSDGGENLKLSRPGEPKNGTVPYIIVDMVNYGDSGSWPATADGQGPSLSRRNPTDYGNDAANWVAGPFGGTPGSAFLPPAAPSMLVATGINSSTIRLSWIDNSSSEDGFHVERSDDGLTFRRIALAAPNSTSFDDTGLSSGRFYTYRIRAYNGASESPYSNTFSASTPGSQQSQIISITDIWRYNQSRTDLGTAWIANGYNDQGAGWGEDDALFYFENAALPAPKNTQLDPGPNNNRTPTFYFRKHFYLDVDPSLLDQVTMRVIVDDGMVAYFNGDLEQAIFWGMPSDPPPTYGSWTGPNYVVNDATWADTDPVPTSWLRQGDNVIAVMVKQTNNSSSDVVFGLEMTISRAIVGLTAAIADVAPDPHATPVNSMTISFSEPVNGFGVSDLRLTRGSGGPNLLTGAQTLASSDGGKTWTLGNLGALTNIAGDYTLQLLANGSNIVSANPGRILAADAIQTFRVTSTVLAGTTATDQYYIRANNGTLEIFGTLPPGTTPAYTSPLDILTSLTINTDAGDDTLHIAGSLPLNPSINAGPGADTLILDLGAHSFANELAAWNFERLDLRGSAAISFTAPQDLDHLAITAGSSVQITASTGAATALGQLTISDTGLLDLHGNALVVRSTPAQRNAVLQQLIGYLKSGRLVSSSLTEHTTLAIALNDNGTGSPLTDELAGVAVGVNDILVKLTYKGDANFDGVVNADDYFQIDSGYISQNKGWHHGDFNYDQVINADDYFMIDSAFIGQTGKLAAAPTPWSGSTPVPAAGKDPDDALDGLFSSDPVVWA